MLDRELIRRFWRDMAREGENRWTDSSLLDYEVQLLGPLVSDSGSILDLGCGAGSLSRRLCPPNGTLVGVDGEAGWASHFSNDRRYSFRHDDVTRVTFAQPFDLVLLFGVVTHLTPCEEERAYAAVAQFTDPGGVAVIKNQCSVGEEFVVNGFSKKLGTNYCGRYPARHEQEVRLRQLFTSVEPSEYPERLNSHSTSRHVAFICRP